MVGQPVLDAWPYYNYEYCHFKQLDERIIMGQTKNVLHDALVDIQSTLKAPKGQYNSFGKYNYRSAEDILEAVKPLLQYYGLTLTIDESIEEISGIAYVESTVSIKNSSESIQVTAQAGIDPNRKGMDIAQSFGSSSSYAKKYALGNLFLLDDTKDPDTAPPPKKTVKKTVPKKKVEKKTTKADSNGAITDEQIAQLRDLAKGADKVTVDHIADAINTGKATQEWADGQIKLLTKK